MGTPDDHGLRREGETEAVISLVEETATVEVRARMTGRTRVSTRTETTNEDVAVTLASQGVDVTRVPVGRDLEPDEPVPGIREEGDTTILPILEEIVIVEKRLRLVEEVHVRRTSSFEDVHVPVTLRRQVADIERESFDADDDQNATNL